ncbi:hypothetical protein B0H65DRAFT_234149 [Neurospora tetraspora]|uniref:Secreted protein n=1 Tax=Neurospora tetraspora TaxID=94610 RepID=A0AAE0MQN1_9PEZI|nr:hypothetical protein B0H65DRAFT_234149 [Neurospora tetraspora]
MPTIHCLRQRHMALLAYFLLFVAIITCLSAGGTEGPICRSMVSLKKEEKGETSPVRVYPATRNSQSLCVFLPTHLTSGLQICFWPVSSCQTRRRCTGKASSPGLGRRGGPWPTGSPAYRTFEFQTMGRQLYSGVKKSAQKPMSRNKAQDTRCHGGLNPENPAERKSGRCMSWALLGRCHQDTHRHPQRCINDTYTGVHVNLRLTCKRTSHKSICG